MSLKSISCPKKAARITYGLNFCQNSKPAFKNLIILKLNDLIQLELDKFMHKHFNNKLPENFQNYFIKLLTIHLVNTRDKHLDSITNSYLKNSKASTLSQTSRSIPVAFHSSQH